MIEEGYTCPTVKPDCDNICKQIADSLNGLAWLITNSESGSP